MNKYWKMLVMALVLIVGVSSLSLRSASASPSTSPTCYRVSEYSVDSLRAVQTALGVRADGAFGPKSCSALQSFQARFGTELQVNGAYGTLGEKTAARLGVTLTKITAATAATTTKPLPVHSGNGKRIVVSKQLNWVWLVDKYGTVIADQGMVFNPGKLPTGMYRIGWKIQNNVAHHGGLLLENYMSFYGNIGFHKIPITIATGKRFHDESVLGKGTVHSSGCIRLGSDFSDTLWAFAGIGTPVFVV